MVSFSVVANGFDHIWPVTADSVAASQPVYAVIAALRNRLQCEVRSLIEFAPDIQASHQMVPDLAPQDGCFVIVNKVDLYWPDIDAARERYINGSMISPQSPGSSSEWVRSSAVSILPVSTGPGGTFSTPHAVESKRRADCRADQSTASMVALMETLEELTNV